MRLDQALANLLTEFSRSRIASWIKDKRVWLNGACGIPSQKVWAGDRVLLDPHFDLPADAPAAIALDIVHEDSAIIVINKPAGLVVHPGAGNRANTLLNGLLHHSGTLALLPRAGIVHRLDKDTSGLLVVAATLASHGELVRQLQARTVGREYLALVHGKLPSSGSVESSIGRHPRKRTRMSVLARGKPAATRYQVLERFKDCSLARVSLGTGRTHQIRVHMQSIGHPIVGDPLYGARRAVRSFPRQALHAERLQFVHPVTREKVSFTVEPPADMKALLQAVRATRG